MSRFIFSKIVKGARIYKPEDLLVRFNESTGHWRPPLLSSLQKARLRRQATIFSIDIAGITGLSQSPPIRWITKKDKGTLRERKRAAKLEFVKMAVQKMPQMIAQWKEERRQGREKLKPKHPF